MFSRTDWQSAGSGLALGLPTTLTIHFTQRHHGFHLNRQLDCGYWWLSFQWLSWCRCSAIYTWAWFSTIRVCTLKVTLCTGSPNTMPSVKCPAQTTSGVSAPGPWSLWPARTCSPTCTLFGSFFSLTRKRTASTTSMWASTVSSTPKREELWYPTYFEQFNIF
jgi:hypothetical protein